tara:strand:- start:213 stop:794 length:582 start_codon:yes stop_codon:yes gene_type:complete
MRECKSISTVIKPDYFKTIKSINKESLSSLEEIYNRLSSNVWSIENARKENDFSCFHHTQHVIFRFIRNFGDPRDFYDNPIWSIFKHLLLPIMNEVAVCYGFKNPVYPKVMLAKLDAHSYINAHYDGAGSNLKTHKIHIPLITAPEVLMSICGKTMHLERGLAYEVNNIKLHSVENRSDQPRVHLIFEVFDNQ